MSEARSCQIFKHNFCLPSLALLSSYMQGLFETTTENCSIYILYLMPVCSSYFLTFQQGIGATHQLGENRVTFEHAIKAC